MTTEYTTTHTPAESRTLTKESIKVMQLSEHTTSPVLDMMTDSYRTSSAVCQAHTTGEVLSALCSNRNLHECRHAVISLFNRPWNDNATPPERMEVMAEWSAMRDQPCLLYTS